MKTKPRNLITGLIALIGSILIIAGKANYGIIFVIIAILVYLIMDLRGKKWITRQKIN